MGKRKIVNALGKVEGREYTEAEGLMPKKRFYRQRAHCNPLNDTVIDTPACPGDVNWSEHYPAFFNQTPGGDKQEEPRVSIADVGCGFGGMSITLATMFPGKLVLGMEIREKVTEYVTRRIDALRKGNAVAPSTDASSPGLYQNVSVVRANTMKYMCNYFHKEQLEKLLFLFPDPHFKASNHRRRIINTHLLTEYAFFLRPGGLLYTITDVEELGVWMKDKIDAHPLFESVSEEEVAADPAAAVLSSATEEGQKVARNKGKTWQGCYRRLDRPALLGER